MYLELKKNNWVVFIVQNHFIKGIYQEKRNILGL